MTEQQTTQSKSISKQVFGDILTKQFLISAVVNFAKAFLNSFLMTLSGHVMYYVSEKLVPSVKIPPQMARTTTTTTNPYPYSNNPPPPPTSPYNSGSDAFGFIR